MAAPTFASRMKEARTTRGLTLRQLAQLSRVDYTWINRLERGERANVSLHHALALADALRVSLDWLTARQTWQYTNGHEGTQGTIDA